MPNRNVSWFMPDKLYKDIQWDDLEDAARYAKGSLLDIGCGEKPYFSIFEKKVTKYIGLDPYCNSADIKEDFYISKIAENSIDTVLATQVLEHLNDPKKFVKKVHKVLKKGGCAIVTVPLLNGVHEAPRDYFRYTRFGLELLFAKEKFEILAIKEQGNFFSMMSFFSCYFLEQTMNRFFLKYPKRVLVLVLQKFFFLASLLPERFVKPSIYPINYIVIARKI